MSSTPTSASGSSDSPVHGSDARTRLWQAGRTSWSIAGILLILVVIGFVLSRIPLVVVP